MSPTAVVTAITSLVDAAPLLCCLPLIAGVVWSTPEAVITPSAHPDPPVHDAVIVCDPDDNPLAAKRRVRPVPVPRASPVSEFVTTDHVAPAPLTVIPVTELADPFANASPTIPARFAPDPIVRVTEAVVLPSATFVEPTASKVTATYVTV